MGIEPAETIAPAAKDFALIFNKVVEASEKAKLSMKLQAVSRTKHVWYSEHGTYY